MRFSPRFLKVFFRLPAPSFFSGVAPSAASVLAICSYVFLHRFLLGNGALARSLAGPRVGPGALAAHRQAPAMAHAAIAADLHQPLDVHRDVLAEVAFDPALLLDDPADLAHGIFRQILDPDVGADARVFQDDVRADPANPEDVRETDLDAFGAREIDACN